MKQTLQVHSENILPIIKKWLYSDKDIFARELVSNACDAIYKVQVLVDRAEIISMQEPRIDIQVNKEERTLKFIDTGIGMNAEEVQKYIAQIAFSGAEEFVNKYQSNQEKDQVIGHFGLGFYSAYMVADHVEIDTLSCKPESEPVLWVCDGSTEYELKTGKRESPGTEITLFVNKESDEYLDEYHLKQILHRYCDFLPYPIYLNNTRINVQEPLWVKSAAECTEKEYLDFYRHLYPMEDEPLFWVHLNVDYPFHLKGILYFPKIRRDLELSKSSIKLYCNRVFVSDSCKDVIPNYLMVLRGVIDSPDIPLNISRSYLQTDRTVRQLAGHISKKVSDSLSTLYRNEHERFIKHWDDVSIVVKLGILEDEKFYERAKEFLVWKNINGEWTTVEDYLERNRGKTKDKILYTRDDKHHSHFIDIYKEKGIEVLMASGPLDPHMINFLERKIAPVTFQRIDADIHDAVLDKSREKTVLDASGKTEATHLADFVRQKLSNDKIEVEAKSFSTESLAGFVMIDENQRRMREYIESLGSDHSSSPMPFADKRTFVVNTNNSLLAAVQKLDKKDPELAKEIINETYDLALLSQREMDPAALNAFVKRTNHVLEALAEKILNLESE